MKNSKLYHLSTVNHDGETFIPRVPLDAYYGGEYENRTTKRVCFSKTITGACLALNFYGGYDVMYVHVPCDIDSINPKKIYETTNDDVFDGEFCEEVWIKQKVKVKCIGKIRVGYNEYDYHDFRKWRPKVHFKYLERYE